ncbi:MAG TPA: 16S rRNA (cytidine(1402)-2'-O)-methyltransferase [Myxococcota bacterium]|nr:16S rRNA (cytidine(1402)-2'-O)-methyltransferase [Myxococcota bacterium]
MTDACDAPSGTLYVVATPVGNLEDISRRALRILSSAPVLACEDTRSTGMLLKALGIDRTGRRMVAYHDLNERRAAGQIVQILLSGHDVALVSDAGTPLVSDPGYRLVSEAAAAGIPVVPVPGPCAPILALCGAGLPSDRFTFMGFVDAKSARRLKAFQSLNRDSGTFIFFVPARTLLKVLDELGQTQPSSTVVVARELTRIHEEFVRGTPAECASAFSGRVVKGEVTILVSVPRD